MSSPHPPKATPLGDAALLLSYASVMSREVADRIRSDAAHIAAANIPYVTDIVPAYTSLAIYFDASNIAYPRVHARVLECVQTTHDVQEPPSRTVTIPVRYDGEDLADVATQTGLSVQEIIQRHSQTAYYTYMLGFVPGFAYLGDLDPALVLPRKSTPRQRVPAGSVAIAGAQTAVYPLPTPGGWHLLGHTDLVMFDPLRDDPSLLRPGDLVRFEPVNG